MLRTVLAPFMLNVIKAMEAPLSQWAGAEAAGGVKEEAGRSAAYNRLRLVLMHDRTQLEPQVLEAMRDELVAVISKYVCIDQGCMELNLETDPESNTVALVANIPVLPVRQQVGEQGAQPTATLAAEAAKAAASS